jgi:hypothetical protein
MDSELFWGGLLAICAWSAFCWYQVAKEQLEWAGALMWMAAGYIVGSAVLLGISVATNGNDPEKISRALAPFGGLGTFSAVVGALGGWMGGKS